MEGMVKLLLDRGADVKTNAGETGNALQAAATTGNIDIVKLLIEHGADVNKGDGENDSPLIAAAVSFFYLLFKSLFEPNRNRIIISGSIFRYLFALTSSFVVVSCLEEQTPSVT